MKVGEFIVKHSLFVIVICTFLVGWLSNTFVSNVGGFDLEKPLDSGFFKAKEINSPSNHIEKDQIHVFKDRVVIEIPGVQWAEFTDTNSMDPFLDIEANSFEIAPKSTKEVQVGDIISYKPTNFNGLIVHRVVETGFDNKGWYCIVKGDNLTSEDPGKVRFDQISGVLVGVVY
jgi:hypothetical protein